MCLGSREYTVKKIDIGSNILLSEGKKSIQFPAKDVIGLEYAVNHLQSNIHLINKIFTPSIQVNNCSNASITSADGIRKDIRSIANRNSRHTISSKLSEYTNQVMNELLASRQDAEAISVLSEFPEYLVNANQGLASSRMKKVLNLEPSNMEVISISNLDLYLDMYCDSSVTIKTIHNFHRTHLDMFRGNHYVLEKFNPRYNSDLVDKAKSQNVHITFDSIGLVDDENIISKVDTVEDGSRSTLIAFLIGNPCLSAIAKKVGVSSEVKALRNAVLTNEQKQRLFDIGVLNRSFTASYDNGVLHINGVSVHCSKQDVSLVIDAVLDCSISGLPSHLVDDVHALI